MSPTPYKFLWIICLGCRTCHLGTLSSTKGSTSQGTQLHSLDTSNEYRTDIYLQGAVRSIVTESLANVFYWSHRLATTNLDTLPGSTSLAQATYSPVRPMDRPDIGSSLMLTFVSRYSKLPSNQNLSFLLWPIVLYTPLLAFLQSYTHKAYIQPQHRVPDPSPFMWQMQCIRS